MVYKLFEVGLNCLVDGINGVRVENAVRVLNYLSRVRKLVVASLPSSVFISVLSVIKNLRGMSYE